MFQVLMSQVLMELVSDNTVMLTQAERGGWLDKLETMIRG